MIPPNLKDAFINNEKATLISIQHLKLLKKEIQKFSEQAELNGFQNWIIDNLYDFNIPNTNFPIKSILLIAIPHPMYTHVEFMYQQQKYHCLSLVMSDFECTQQNLQKTLHLDNYHILEAPNIPLKRLAVHSGLATYGRNNICYIDGLGSNFSFSAYFSDIPCENSNWSKIKLAPLCEKCKACLINCPTGAIREDNFLINNEICLANLNESSNPFPDWLPIDVHHCIYDCLKCQINCPMNKNQKKFLGKPIQFSESETNTILSGEAFNNYSESLKKKAKYLGMHQWPDGIPKNLKVIIDLNEIHSKTV